jgi:hypothetical protein
MTENIIFAICCTVAFCVFFGGLFWYNNRQEERDHERLFFKETGKLPKRYLK